MEIGGERVEVISGAGPARGAEAAPVVGDHPVPGGEQGCLLLFPRVPVLRVAVDQHDRGTGPVIFLVDPDGGCILPPDGDKRHRGPRRLCSQGDSWPSQGWFESLRARRRFPSSIPSSARQVSSSLVKALSYGGCSSL